MILNIKMHRKDSKKAPMLHKWIVFCYETHVSTSHALQCFTNLVPRPSRWSHTGPGMRLVFRFCSTSELYLSQTHTRMRVHMYMHTHTHTHTHTATALPGQEDVYDLQHERRRSGQHGHGSDAIHCQLFQDLLS